MKTAVADVAVPRWRLRRRSGREAEKLPDKATDGEYCGRPSIEPNTEYVMQRCSRFETISESKLTDGNGTSAEAMLPSDPARDEDRGVVESLCLFEPWYSACFVCVHHRWGSGMAV